MRLPRQEHKKARIEIIPMIDAIFFLLVFFMMTSLSMVQLNARKVNLPESTTAAVKPEARDRIVVSVTKKGDYYIDREMVKLEQILPLVSERVRRNPNVSVIINCDRDQQVQQFSRVFDLVKQANAATVLVATNPKTPDQLGKITTDEHP